MVSLTTKMVSLTTKMVRLYSHSQSNIKNLKKMISPTVMIITTVKEANRERRAKEKAEEKKIAAEEALDQKDADDKETIANAKQEKGGRRGAYNKLRNAAGSADADERMSSKASCMI